MVRRLRRIEVTPDEFYAAVTDRNGCTFVSLKAKYVPTHFLDLDRKGRRFPYFCNIYCFSRVTCAVGVDYQNAVNNARERAGKSRSFSRKGGDPWGTPFKHENDAAIIHNVNDGRRYLQVMVIKREYDYRRRDNNHHIPLEAVLPWRDEEQTTEGVVLRRFRFDHLVEVVMRRFSEPKSQRFVLTR